MREYFEKQLENAQPLTDEMIEGLKQNRIANGVSTDSLDGVVPGDVFLYVMVNYDQGLNEDGSRGLQCNIEKILEREIDEFCSTHEFLEMVGKDGAMPRFKEKDNVGQV